MQYYLPSPLLMKEGSSDWIEFEGGQWSPRILRKYLLFRLQRLLLTHLIRQCRYRPRRVGKVVGLY